MLDDVLVYFKATLGIRCAAHALTIVILNQDVVLSMWGAVARVVIVTQKLILP